MLSAIKKNYSSLVLKITFNQFLIDKRTQRHHPLLSVPFGDIHSDRKIEKKVSSFYGKHDT